MNNICVIQGDIRTDKIGIIIREMQKHFEKVIVSTWKGEETKLPKGDYEVLLNELPKNNGLSHRNCQRLSVAKGIQEAKKLGAEFVLKWRTDLLPTNFDLNLFILLSNKDISDKMTSRIVMPAFRNLSVEPDWFSSFPDHFAFGRIAEMELLWDDKGINYELDFNVPNEMFRDSRINNVNGKIFYKNKDLSNAYDAHVELYALFKSRMERFFNKKFMHPDIVKNYCYLLNHDRLKICWFAGNNKFRSIEQALMHPWWTEGKFIKNSYTLVEPGYQRNRVQEIVGYQKTRFVVNKNLYMQSLWFRKYLTNGNK